MSAEKITYATLTASDAIHAPFEKALKDNELNYGKHYPMYIGDREVMADDEFATKSPIDSNITLGYFQKGTADHMKDAINMAHEAFPSWEARDWRERVKIIAKVADVLADNIYSLAATACVEVGKIRSECIAEVSEAIEAINYNIAQIEKNEGFTHKMAPGAPGENTQSTLRPYGAWVVISPFNFPLMLASGMTQTALMTGNTVVIKPTSEAPLATLGFYHALREAGVPPGVINFVTGPGSSMEAAISANPEVAGIGFTGSKEIGVQLRNAFLTKQPFSKPILCEMGSKNPTIVSEKADLSKAVEGITRASFGYTGQKCSATSRIYVKESIMSQLVEKLQERASKVVTGDPRNKDVFMGPVINSSAVQTYNDVVDEIKRDGGDFVIGPQSISSDLSGGNFVTPIIAKGLPHSHRLFRDELFLPIVLIDTYQTLDEAITKANDTEFGLTAGIFSEDNSEIKEFFRRIQVGVAYANRKGGSTTGAWPGAQPFGGWKASTVTGKGLGGHYYMPQFVHEQAQTTVIEE